MNPPTPGPGRPPIREATADTPKPGVITIQTTMDRKSAYVRKAYPKPLTAWILKALDDASGYKPPNPPDP
jgi:hypothetical protein